MANSTKNKVKKHFDFYNDSMWRGRMRVEGLCRAAQDNIIDPEIFLLFKPTENDIDELVNEKHLPAEFRDGFWAAGLPYNDDNRPNQFTPLRQTIVLFMAAINEEL